MRMYICGEWVDRDEKMPVINPFDQSAFDTVPRRRREGRVRHHVEEADVELPNVLTLRTLGSEDLVPFAPEPVERRKVGMGDERHRSVVFRSGMVRDRGDPNARWRAGAWAGFVGESDAWACGARAQARAGRRAQTLLTRAGAEAAAAAASRIPATSSTKSASSRTPSAARASTV